MITRILTFLSVSVSVLVGQTLPSPVFPGGVVGNQNLFIGYPPPFPPISLTSAMTASASSFTVSTCGGVTTYAIVKVELEEIAVLSCSSNIMTVANSPINGRGFDGTTAVSHVPGNYVLLTWQPWLTNSPNAEIKAIEGYLSGMSIVPTLPTGPVTVIADGNYNAFPVTTYTCTGKIAMVNRRSNSHADTPSQLDIYLSANLGQTFTFEDTITSSAVLGGTLGVFPGGIATLPNCHLILSYVVEDYVTSTAYNVFTVESTDQEGLTWSAPINVTNGVGAAGYQTAAPPVYISNNTLLMPVYNSPMLNVQVYAQNRTTLAWSLKATINTSSVVDDPSEGFIAVNPTTGDMVMSIRDFNVYQTAFSYSSGDGSSWTTPVVAWGAESVAPLVFDSQGNIVTSYRCYHTPVFQLRSTASSGSTSLSVPSAAGFALTLGMSVVGTNIPNGATITAVSGTTVTISLATTGAFTLAVVTFSNDAVNSDWNQMCYRRSTDGGHTWSAEVMTQFSSASWMLYSSVINLPGGLIGNAYSLQRSSNGHIADVYYSYLNDPISFSPQVVTANGVTNIGTQKIMDLLTGISLQTDGLGNVTLDTNGVSTTMHFRIANQHLLNNYFLFDFDNASHVMRFNRFGGGRLGVGDSGQVNGNSYGLGVFDTTGFDGIGGYVGGNATGIAFKGSNTNAGSGDRPWFGCMPNSGSDIACHISTYGNKGGSNGIWPHPSGGLGFNTTYDPGSGNEAHNLSTGIGHYSSNGVLTSSQVNLASLDVTGVLPVGNLPTNVVPTVVTVTFSATPVFTVSSLANTTLQITLTGNVTSSTFGGGSTGQMVTFKICQDGTGSRTFAFPAAVHGGMTIGSTASTCSIQPFIFDGSLLYAMSAGVTNQ